VANTLAYYNRATITTVKKFYGTGSWTKVLQIAVFSLVMGLPEWIPLPSSYKIANITLGSNGLQRTSTRSLLVPDVGDEEKKAYKIIF